MYSTKPSNSLKKLFAGYHQPLPLSKRQSQEIVTGLKASFRRQLDNEYGRSTQDVVKETAADSQVPVRRSAAHQHLKSILSNPLFGQNKNLSNPISAGPDPYKPGPPKHEQDLIAVFDHAVSKGMMTLQAATGWMHAKRAQMVAQNKAGIVHSGSPEVASRVVKWLISSGLNRSLTFLESSGFLQQLIPFLYIEKMEGVAWQWLERVMNDETLLLTADDRSMKASSLLQQMIRVRHSPQFQDPNAAITTILDAEVLLRNHPRLPRILIQPWRAVSWYSTVEASREMSPSGEYFGKHLATAEIINKPLLVEKAHLSLYHPGTPDPSPALDLLLHNDTLSRYINKTPEQLAASRPLSQMNWLDHLAQDTLKYLNATGRAEEAENVRSLLLKKFPMLATHTTQAS